MNHPSQSNPSNARDGSMAVARYQRQVGSLIQLPVSSFRYPASPDDLYLGCGRPGDDDVVAVEEEGRHGGLVAAGALGGRQHLEDARLALAFVNVHVVDECGVASAEHRLVLSSIIAQFNSMQSYLIQSHSIQFQLIKTNQKNELDFI